MKNNTIQRINKMGKVGGIICLILKIACIVLGGIMLLGGLMSVIASEEYTLEMQEMTEMSLESFRAMMLVAVAVSVYGILTFHFAGKLCKVFKNCQTPFTLEAAKAMKRFAWSLLPMDLLVLWLNGIVVGGLIVFLSAFLFFLSRVFQHGVALQTEADELL